MLDPQLLSKYDVQAPRYTSYPTVPYWSDNPTTEQWVHSLNTALSKKNRTENGEERSEEKDKEKNKGNNKERNKEETRDKEKTEEKASWSLYIHIPYCERLCTFCGCNTSITRNHEYEAPYVNRVLKEWQSYLEKVSPFRDVPLKQIHLGGGTPTFLSAQNLTRLIEPIFKATKINLNDFEAAIEVDPRHTSSEQLKVLYDMGFRRVSMGVQDFNSKVQKLVNRIQPFSMTKDLTEKARNIGYTSVNFDLIYGLPQQDLEGFKRTIEQTIDLRPDRIALYSFAKVPWIKPAQRLFKDGDLPEGAEKRALYEMSRHHLVEAGYVEMGMDHFSLKTDGLYQSSQRGQLHRNFMGYTDKRTEVLLGLGVSAISESPTCFHQNEKVLPIYERRAGQIPTLRGHLLNAEDIRQRKQILSFMTQFEVHLYDEAQESDLREFLKPLIEDQLVVIDKGVMKLTQRGHPFLRNACMGLDTRLRTQRPYTRIFSQSL